MTTKRKVTIDPQAIKQRLEQNKEKQTKKEKISISENPILKVEAAGKYKFRATYYPHSEDPSVDPFPQRHYHFGIPGTGIVFCPQMNDGKTCSLCDFVWDQMKSHKGNKEKVREWSDKLPKSRIWVPGKLRGDREVEGYKFFTFGTYKEKMSDVHSKIYDWFLDEETYNWLDPDEGIDMELEYEEYDLGRQKQLNAKFGLKKGGVSLARKDSKFGGDFDAFLDTIPDIDDNDNQILKSYSRKTPEETKEALQRWMERLNTGDKESVQDKEIDTSSSDEEQSSSEETEEQSALKEKLKKLGVKV